MFRDDSYLEVVFDPSRCENCGYCIDTAPAVFAEDRGGTKLVNGRELEVVGGSIAAVPFEHASETEYAAKECPTEALQIIYPRFSTVEEIV